ncbi:MAG: hypothetical protein SFU56_07285 [Capsulimonadales bacterium]|nr:hypothetical protein [Capsulimonadales bacterium]
MMNENWCQAIRERKRVRLTYGGGGRLVEMHIYGTDAAGEPYVRAFQVSGHSNTGTPTGWKLFRAEEVHDWSVTPETFTGPRAGYKPDDPVVTNVYCRI